MNTAIENTATAVKGQPNTDRILVERICVALSGTFKKINLYPDDHAIYKTALISLHRLMAEYLTAHGDLQLEVERGQIRYQGQLVFSGDDTDENPAFIMFRDGIYRVEFKATLAEWELHGFLKVLQKNQILTEESENDVVTNLWEKNFPSLAYRADDVGFDTGEAFEIPDLVDTVAIDADEEPPDEAAEDQDSDSLSSVSESAATTNLSLKNKALWELTDEDRRYLKRLASEEEEWESIEYVLYILLYILEHQTQPDTFSDVIDILFKELQSALVDCKFESVCNTVEMLSRNLVRHRAEGHWSVTYLEDFLTALSKPAFVNVLDQVWERIDANMEPTLVYLKKWMLLLKPDTVLTLGPMLLNKKSPPAQKILMETIAALGATDFQPLKALMSACDTNLLEMLIHALGFMTSEPSLKALVGSLKHEFPGVRQHALKAIIRRQIEVSEDIFPLIDDPDEDVRRRFLQFMGQKRDEKAEKLLLNYLEQHPIRSSNKQHLFAVYASLGRCGSDRSIDFLRKELYFWPRLGILRSKNSPRRQAAVYALQNLKTEKAGSVLAKT